MDAVEDDWTKRSHLETRDRNFVTELVYGTTRQRRSCDWLIDRFLLSDLDPDSLNLALLIVKLEERTGRDPFRLGFENFETVGELVALYQRADGRSS